MKKTLTMLGMGACVLVAFSSCQSTDGDGFGGYEETATVMSDDQLPPWLLEDSGDTQVSAGSRTDYAIPEPDETLADSGASLSSGQVQSDMASSGDVVVENDPHDIVVSSPDESLSGGSVAVNPPTVTPTRKPQPIVTNKETRLSPQERKKVIRVDKPTLITYKVRRGDSLSEIAKRSGTTVAAIRKASGIKGDTIYAGSTIKVPYTPKGYRNLNGGAQGGKATKHTVRRGETVSGIASRYGLTTAQVLRANNMSQAQASRIRPGQTLNIPGKGGKVTKSGKGKRGSKKPARRRSRR